MLNENGKPWFVVTDICRALNYTNVTAAVNPLDRDERSKFNLGRQGNAWAVNESGLYTLILRSRSATTPGTIQHRFRKWVTSEVLPAIRKTGSYSVDQSKEVEIWKERYEYLSREYMQRADQSKEIKKLKADVHTWKNRHKALLSMRRRRGWPSVETPAIAAHATPIENICNIIRDVRAAQISLDKLHESEDGALLQDMPDAYLKATDNLHAVIVGLSEYIGLHFINTLPV